MTHIELWQRTLRRPFPTAGSRFEAHQRHVLYMLYAASAASLALVAVCAYVVTHAQ